MTATFLQKNVAIKTPFKHRGGGGGQLGFTGPTCPVFFGQVEVRCVDPLSDFSLCLLSKNLFLIQVFPLNQTLFDYIISSFLITLFL